MFLWAFAFWHAPEATPEWLLRAQSACFGRTASGLPDAGGWVTLVLAPLLFLSCLLVAFGGEIRSALTQFASARNARLCAAGLLAVLVLESWWVGGRIAHGLRVTDAQFAGSELPALPADYPRSALKPPSFANLVDQHGERLGETLGEGKTLILTFAFAHCTTICPSIVRTAQQAHRKLPPGSSQLVIVTLDPWRDTPGSLPTLAKQWGLSSNETSAERNGDERVLSGEVTLVNNLLGAMKMSTTRDERTGDIAHPALLYVFDSAQRTAYILNNPSVSWITEAALRLNADEASRNDMARH